MSEKKYILAIDQGTSSSRAILFNKNIDVIGMEQQEFEQIFRHPGWVEHNPADIWNSVLTSIYKLLDDTGVVAEEIDSIGITNQRETTVLWDKRTGRSIYNAIVWQDRRTNEIVDQLIADGHKDTFFEKTGLVIDSYFSGVKVKWILDNVPNARELAEQGYLMFGTIDTWLLWKLTNQRSFATDVSNASRTLMYNINTHEWDQELLDILDIPKSILPKVQPSSSLFGEASSGLLGIRVPVTSIIGDQQSATFGNLCTNPGEIKYTYGTGGFMMMNIGERIEHSRNNLLTTVGWKIEDKKPLYMLEGSVFMCGALIQWLRDGLQIISHASEVEGLANTVSDSGGVTIIPSFTGMGAPHWIQDTKGTIVGLTRGTSKAHIARAALDAIAMQTYDVFKSMVEDVKENVEIKTLRVDGGAAINDTLLQIDEMF